MQQRYTPGAAGLLLLCLNPVLASAQISRPDLGALAGVIDNARETLGVPGMSVAIVENGEVVLARGFGERTLGEADPVDEHTLFAIGSSTKSFTSAAVAMLVDAGELSWNERVMTRLPGFRLHDPYPTSNLTIIDMLSHRGGLPRGDMVWYGSNASRAEIIERLPRLEPNSSFRSQFGYQNIMYLAAGEMIREVSGVSWDDWMTERIFKPLGMHGSNTSISALEGLSNVATPHVKTEAGVVTVPYRRIDNIAAAGSINSSAADMAKWVTMLLSGGRAGANEDAAGIITKGSLDVMWTPMTVATATGPAGALRAESNFLLYGLGWFLEDYRGERVVHHGGNIDGMSALVALMPRHNLGVVVLTNMNGTPAPTVVAQTVFDAYLGKDDHDWAAEAKGLMDTIEKVQAEARAQARADRITGTSPTLPLDAYAGRYRHEFYGEIEISLDNGRLSAAFGELAGDLDHWHYNTFELVNRAPHPELGLVNFVIGADGKVAELIALGIDEWRKVPEAPTADTSIELSEEDLRRYVGTYLNAGIGLEVNVFVADGALKAQIPGQPAFEMLATGADEFALGGLPPQITVRITFTTDESGRASVMTFTQTPGGTFELPRVAR